MAALAQFPRAPCIGPSRGTRTSSVGTPRRVPRAARSRAERIAAKASEQHAMAKSFEAVRPSAAVLLRCDRRSFRVPDGSSGTATTRADRARRVQARTQSALGACRTFAYVQQNPKWASLSFAEPVTYFRVDSPWSWMNVVAISIINATCPRINSRNVGQAAKSV